MKRLALTPQLVAATLFLAAGLQAEDTKPGPKPATAPQAGMKNKRDGEMLKRFDKNGDGKLDDEERAAAGKYARERGPGAGGGNIRAETIRRLDKNGDGKIDDTERAEGVSFIAANLDQFPGLKQRFDKNSDGKLDEVERTGLDRGLKMLAQTDAIPSLDAMAPAMREQAIRRFDKDGDGKLGESELAALQGEMARRRAQRMAQVAGGAPLPAKSEEPRVVDKEEEARLDKTMEDFAPRIDAPKPDATPKP